MQFGMILLVLVIACSFAGSMIVQNREPMEYVERYGADAAQLILALKLNDVFSTPYFLVLMAALCLNLTLCSIVRLPRTMRSSANLRTQAQKLACDEPLQPGQAQKLGDFLRSRGFRCQQWQERSVFTKNLFGYYGSFFTHLSFLLILLVGAAALVTAEVTDQTVMPGETISFADGVSVTVEDFQIEDETGKLDYASTLHAISADGKREAKKQIRVNEPLSFEGYKIYQQTYGTAGSVEIANLQTGVSEVMALTESCFLTLDGRNGLFFQALYPGYVKTEDGSVTLVTSTSGEYADPVYDVLSVADGAMTPVLAFPEETLTIGDVSFTMKAPISYPGLRIKHMNSLVLVALYAVFALMVAALYLCFFMTPVAVAVTEDGYAVVSPKAQTGLMIELEALIKEANE